MTLYLVDASGLIYRAFHAIRPLRTSRGLQTNALFGLATMLRKFVKARNPEHVVVVFDSARATFRSDLFAEYKANRPEPPADLAAQFPIARRVAAAMGFPILELPGFEADDVIATLCRRARQAGHEVVIESGDKDLFQLVGDGVTAFDPMREKTYDSAGVREKMGVDPGQVRDWLALVGDASDNVPGVPGIGDKGATELIAAYGSLDGVYANLAALTPRKREALEQGRDSAYLSRKLVTLDDNVPVDIDLGAFQLKTPDRETLLALLTELEFKTLLEEVQRDGRVDVQHGAAVAREIGTDVTWAEALRRVEAEARVAVVASFGSRTPDAPDCKGLAVALSPSEALVARPADLQDAELAAFAKLLATRPYCAPHSKELHQVFAARGLDVPLPAMDPVLASYVLHSERESHGLESVSLETLSRPLPPAEDVSGACMAARAVAAYALWDALDPALDAPARSLLSEVELPLARVLAEMERTGVAVDRDALATLSVSLGSDLQRLEKRIIEAAGVPFNPNSPKQLADVLFGKLMLPVVRKTKTGPSTDMAVLEELSGQHPVPALIVEYRQLAKLKGTYADALPLLVNPRTGRIHTSYNQAVASTGRLSSSDPNLQNIPIRTETGRKIRSAFVAGPGWEFVSADYSQIELRVLAHLSGDESLIEAFRTDRDIHARTAARIFHADEAAVTPDMRRTAKVINFGLLYGMGAFRVSRDLKIPMADAQRIIDDYFGAFPSVRAYLDGTVEQARKEGWVATLAGRRRRIEGIHSPNRNERAGAERMALNAPIQGTAADIIKVAMVRLRDRLRHDGLDARLVLQVHDELVLEAREGQGDRVAEVLREVMEGASPLCVPVKVEVGRGHRWSELHG